MDEDELQDDQLDADGDNEDADSGSDNSAPPENESEPADKGKDRIAGLMSNWQKAEARAKKAEAALAALSGGAQQGEAENGTNDRINEFEEFARDNARITLFNSDPRLAENDLKPEDITGTTLAEMRASFAKHQKLIAGMEGRMRNRILAEHGLDPDVATGAGTETTPSFSKMTDKQFADFLAARDARPR